MAEFLLNARLCSAGLDIQIRADQHDDEQRDDNTKQNEHEAEQLRHAGNVTQRIFEEKMNDTVVILNPAANSDRARRERTRIEALAENCQVCTTSGRGEAETLARHAANEGFTKIVAAGGDGTINEVVNGLAGTESMLGLLPMGTVNVFASELGLPSHDLESCWRVIEEGHTRVVDLPNANGKYFVQLAGVGLDAQAVKETSASLKHNFGPLSYLISAAQIAARQPPRLFIESDGREKMEGSFVLIGNGRRYGGPFPFFKQAMLDDGLLDVVAFKQLGYFEILRYLQEVFFSSDIRVPEIEYFQTKRLRISSDDDVPVELDGELVGSCPVEFEIREKTLRVLAPARD
jgi:YegS/Rv2252/BmrU family lipid kinase